MSGIRGARDDVAEAVAHPTPGAWDAIALAVARHYPLEGAVPVYGPDDLVALHDSRKLSAKRQCVRRGPRYMERPDIPLTADYMCQVREHMSYCRSRCEDSCRLAQEARANLDPNNIVGSLLADLAEARRNCSSAAKRVGPKRWPLVA